MSSPLTLRNLSSVLVRFAVVETFEDPNTLQSKQSYFSFAPRNTTSSNSSSKLAEQAQSFIGQRPDIYLSPFESYTPQINYQNGEDSTQLKTFIIRLTIVADNGQRYRIDVNPTYTQKTWISVVPLSPNPAKLFDAIYHPSSPTSHLTIVDGESLNLSAWMADIPSELPLSAISIPGTHNSHTCYRALPSVRCQAVSVQAQLENGIRFLDIRVVPSLPDYAKDLALVHGDFPISLTGTKYLEPVLQTCYKFLGDHESECILISLKREGMRKATDEELSQILDKHYITPHKDKWYIGTAVPYLKDVRGKLVLIRRYNIHESLKASPEDHSYGLDATAWPHNSTHALHGPFCVQDYCEVMKPAMIPEKSQYSKEHLERAAKCTAFVPGVNTDEKNPVPAGPLYLNFLSGSNFWSMGTWPNKISLRLNRDIEEWICRRHHLERASELEEGDTIGIAEGNASGVIKKALQGDGSTGVVVMDHVGERGDWDLVKLIVGLNKIVNTKYINAME